MERKGHGGQEESREKAGWVRGGRLSVGSRAGGCRPQAHLCEGHWRRPGPGSHHHTPSSFLPRGIAVSRVGKE